MTFPHLHNVDHSEKRMEQELIVEGQSRLQTVIYPALDYSGEKWCYTEEGHQYILDARPGRVSQRFVTGYLDKIKYLMYTFPGVGYVHPQADSSAKSNSRIFSRATER